MVLGGYFLCLFSLNSLAVMNLAANGFSVDVEILLSLQFAYIRVDKFRYEIFYPDVLYANYTIKNTPDKKSFLCNSFWEAKQTIMETDQRMKLFTAEDERDYDIDHFMFTYTINLCKFLKGATNNVVGRMIADDYFRSLGKNYSCPIKKGTIAVFKDMLITDALIPPMPTETRFRLENTVFAKLEGQKKYLRMYKWNMFLKIKKELLPTI
jgi:Protein of unknown function (DUF1091)